MEEKTKRLWDVVLGVVAPILTVVTILIGVCQFEKGENDKVVLENNLLVKKDQIDFQRKLWLNKLETYKAILTLTGKIAAAVDLKRDFSPTLDPLAIELTAAYWGQSVFVEDQPVYMALRDFHQSVNDFQHGLVKADTVKIKADALAEACKASIESDAPEGAWKPAGG